jgi:hypothetical protein
MFLFCYCLQNKTCLDGLSELRGDLIDGLVLGLRHRDSDIFVIVNVDVFVLFLFTKQNLFRWFV